MRRFMVRAAGAAVAVLVTAGVVTVPSSTEAATPHRAVYARAAAVTLKAPARVDKGNRLVLTGTVRNRAVGTPVVVQRMLRYVGEWQNVGRTKVGKRGAVRFVDVPHRAGDRYYRLVVPTKHSRVQSRAVLVTVWEWIDLSELPFHERVATFQRQTVYDQSAERHEDGILADRVVDSGYMEWEVRDTRGACTRVQARLTASGIDLAHGRLVVDGVVVAAAEFLDGGGEIGVSKDISGADLLRFEWDKQAGSSTSPAMIDSSIYCPF
ncbi:MULTISPECIES: hypothetical protein [unclassified Nocardioides]|uniref:hypothetical protein n=1 Tax=unclassified Nocardioides TaxID=2615069 RepID=UPI000AC9623D|nr:MULTISPECIES: hypothetical protein [unclassified Nocardioides]